MRYRILLLLMLLGAATSAPAQVSISINFSLFPELVQVPDYPVYYAPRQNANYFFYDGLYWVLQDDEWYSSEWYNGPWWRTAPEYVPAYVLRIPVRYYRRPPAYFRGWGRDAPPRWGEHWGRDWEQRRSGWDKWDRRSAPKPAPLPTYQRQYKGDKYPRLEQQQTVRDQKYRYQPRDAVVRDHVRPPMRAASTPAARDRQAEPQRKDAGKDARERESERKEPTKDARERDQRSTPARPPTQRSEPPAQHQPTPAAPERRQESPRKDSGKDGRERDQRPPPQAATPREPPPQPRAEPRREPPPPTTAPPREKGGEPNRGKGQEREREKDDRGHDKK